MIHGGNVKIIPSWVPQTTIVDLQWDDTTLSDPRPKGAWWGEIAFLVQRAAGNQGEWEWEPAAGILELWVPDPDVPGYRHLVATLDQFTLPLANPGTAGAGRLAPGLAPVVGDLTLDWQGSLTL
ncbi:hypothetical protein ABT234_13565 [Streptomyces sp. NPDC001586]|uniref:hypothetical protein n=1 Tax=unclassified Streptomyces TaxID=2593676 RepID=UPI003326945C